MAIHSTTKISQAIGVEMTQQHQVIIELAQQYYKEHGHSPGMKQIVQSSQTISQSYNSIELMRLFGSSPAKIICKLAGIPKPKRCL